MQIYRTFIYASMLKLKAMNLTWCVCWLLVSFLHLISLPGNNGSNIVEVPRYVTAAAAPAPTLEVPRTVTAAAAPAPPLEVPTYITAAVPPDRPSTVPTYITAAVPPDRPSTVPTYITAAVPPSEVSSTPVLINPPNLAPAPSEFPNTTVSVPRRQRKTMKRFIITLVSSIGAFFGLCVIVSVCVFLSRKKRGTGEIEEDYLDQMPGMPARFTYEELKALEGLVDIERNLDYKFWIPPVRRTIEEVGHEEGGIGATTTVLPSKLSGPRSESREGDWWGGERVIHMR
ncbi:hypothetical protein Acr_23g0014410 [Actinidia rufa]|uniref:Transmembrane protein n=1 Tax=Actinidia rufa TaxID=165716 RepID=A0A7J0GQH5_9ERIC|nr:hypothetical protein Acr_23g0014410 [Actinidia rufa]